MNFKSALQKDSVKYYKSHTKDYNEKAHGVKRYKKEITSIHQKKEHNSGGKARHQLPVLDLLNKVSLGENFFVNIGEQRPNLL